MSDPMEKILSSDSDPYRFSPSKKILEQVMEVGSTEFLADSVEKMLERIALLELFLENRTNITIIEEELTEFQSSDHEKVQEATLQLTHLFFGSISRREGG